jgi:mono/diheme cytochrome c family protein
MRTSILVGAVALVAFGGGVALGQYGGTTQYVRIPLYGAGAAPAANDQTSEVQPEWAKRVESKLDKLLKLLEELDEKTPDTSKTGTNAALQTAAETCAKCHADNFKADGGGFQLFQNGDFRNFSERDVDKIVTELERERMPPPKSKYKLTPTERTALLEAFKPTTNKGKGTP